MQRHILVKKKRQTLNRRKDELKKSPFYGTKNTKMQLSTIPRDLKENMKKKVFRKQWQRPCQNENQDVTPNSKWATCNLSKINFKNLSTYCFWCWLRTNWKGLASEELMQLLNREIRPQRGKLEPLNLLQSIYQYNTGKATKRLSLFFSNRLPGKGQRFWIL